jgi:hypothetical protein
MLCAILLFALVIPPTAAAQGSYPRLSAVEPDAGSVGDTLVVSGENLGSSIVKDLYLTDGQTDWKTEIVEQTDAAITFKIPADAKVGRFNLMVLTAGSEPRLIEQPVKVTVQ